MTETDRVSRLTELRDAFDRTFTEAPAAAASGAESVLAIGVAGIPYAVRLSEVSGLFAGRNVTRLPGSVPQLLGIAGFRGEVRPVYDLAALLGLPDSGEPRWMLTVAATPVALAFGQFDGYLQVTSDALLTGSGETHGGHVQELVRAADGERPLISLASVIGRIRRLAARDQQEQKQ